jgi:hypothetical protein
MIAYESLLEPLASLMENNHHKCNSRTSQKEFLTRTFTLRLVIIFINFQNFLTKHPFMVGTRPQLIVVLGLLVGIPLTVGFRPQLVVFSGLFGGNPFDGGI